MRRKPIQTVVNGTEHHGEYEVAGRGENAVVTVFYRDGQKSTQRGGSPETSIARMLLSELARAR